MDLLYLIGGLFLIMIGADKMTDGAAAIAQKLKVSELVIGLTIVAFGTSAPELVVSLFSSIKGSSGIAIGNIIGSNIFNTLMIVGCTAIIYPFTISRKTLRNEIPLSLLASFVICILLSDIFLDKATNNYLSRADGFILLSFFAIFLSYTFNISKDTISEEATNPLPIWKSIIFLIVGLIGLIVGGNLFVEGASGIAHFLGVSNAIIGLTIVSIGTSLPELAVSISAARKKKAEMAVGNAIGSNLFNIFFVLGVSSSITPMTVKGFSYIHLVVLLLSGVLLFVVFNFFDSGKRKINRKEGVFMVTLYCLYMTYLVLQQTRLI